jgi:hypothetical protein
MTECGFGCRIHHILGFAYTAYSLERTFYIKNDFDSERFYVKPSSNACNEQDQTGF